MAEQATTHAIMLIGTDARVRWWSPGAERIFGIPSSDMRGQDISKTFIAEDIDRGVPDHEMAVAKASGAAEDDRWMARADGSRFWAGGVLIALRDERGDLLGFGKILRDRTEVREQLDAYRNRLEAAAATDRRKDVFLSTLSHELRNPLAPLSNAAQIIRMTGKTAPELETPLKIIERQIASLQRLVDDLLDVSRIGSGKIELRKEKVALDEVVHSAVETARPAVDGRRHRLEVLLPPTSIIIEADPARLRQVFVNLINNAAKYTPEGGNIWINGTVEGDEVVVHVRDTGVGIPHDVLPRIFELFTQVESSRSQSQGGMGIGLNLVKNLVTLHGGSVQVRSDGENKGSRFTVRLPVEARL
ncbi:MAG TPA: PAS domain-containing sensor histidine kinase [Gammaproteobacteria bacterium]|nr:PAS domain-containing sensor histidine kinase [Gammaproteobacteria bacterium]